jgi:hypothetical protein
LENTMDLKKPSELICYCFNYTKKDIQHDLEENGYSRIFQQIIDAKGDGRCDCADKNPKGR